MMKGNSLMQSTIKFDEIVGTKGVLDLLTVLKTIFEK